MSLSKPNRSAATISSNRVDPSPLSGICVTCLDGCEGPCEIGRSALKGREVIYPQPFGKITAGAEKDYPADFSYFNIQGTCVGAVGVEADPDKATFPAVDCSTQLGADGSINMAFPVFTGAGVGEGAGASGDEEAVAGPGGDVLEAPGSAVAGFDRGEVGGLVEAKERAAARCVFAPG